MFRSERIRIISWLRNPRILMKNQFKPTVNVFLDIIEYSTADISGQTMSDFNKLFKSANVSQFDNATLDAFIGSHFLKAGSDVVTCSSSDWNPSPPKFSNIKDRSYRTWAFALNNIWKKLCKKVLYRIDPKIRPRNSKQGFYVLSFGRGLVIQPISHKKISTLILFP